MDKFILPKGMKISLPNQQKESINPDYLTILTTDALMFTADLLHKFGPIRDDLLLKRKEREKELEAGNRPTFLLETQDIRTNDWKIDPIPNALQCRRVEITGPVERKMLINALNSGADSFMADFEDANTPTWDNQLQGQVNLYEATRGTISLNQNGKHYRLNDKTATLFVRPRGWHLDEKHVTLDDKPISGGIFDFALYLFHNAKTLLNKGAGPYFYLPKIESHLEARLWNDIFTYAETTLDIPKGSIRATVLIETILAAFEMDEILYELREHSAGLNAGRWDYIFSCIKKFKNNSEFCLADRSKVTMTAPFMRAYALLLIKTCHKRNAPAIGGMSALIPIKNDPVKNQQAIEGIRLDKRRDANDGYDGGWIAHPGLVEPAMAEFKAVLGDKVNQIDKQRNDVLISEQQLLDFQPEQPITEIGVRNNINVGIHYLGSWLSGNGAVPIHNLMEDVATAEIARSQIWQWIHSPKGVLENGEKVTATMIKNFIPDELIKVKTVAGDHSNFDRAAVIFEEMSIADDFIEFLTLPLYAEL